MHHEGPTNRIQRLIRRRAGAAPGTLVIDAAAPPPVLRIVAYGPGEVQERTVTSVSDVDETLAAFEVVWLNVDGLGDESLLREIGDTFGLHRLVLEDVVKTDQRAKVEPYDDLLFIVARMMSGAGPADEQVSMILRGNLVLTFQERTGDCFDPVRERIRHGRGRIRKVGADYLAYALLDAIIDSYFVALEAFGDRLEGHETDLLDQPKAGIVESIHTIRRELLTVRRAIWPLREALSSLLRDEYEAITPPTRIYLRDCYDHVVQVIDMVETYRELASSQMDLYVSTLGQKTNEIMKVLTIFAAVFIPLSFIAGLYGMNFETDSPFNLPELSWRYGYPFALGVMIAVAGTLLWLFKRKGWIGAGKRAVRHSDTPRS